MIEEDSTAEGSDYRHQISTEPTQPFKESQWQSFGGRRSEVEEVVELLETYGALIIHGVAGTGKTSLLAGGVFHHLRDQGLADGIFHFRAAPAKLGKLHELDFPKPSGALSLKGELDRLADAVGDMGLIHENLGSVWSPYVETAKPGSPSRPPRILFVFDGFEEALLATTAVPRRGDEDEQEEKANASSVVHAETQLIQQLRLILRNADRLVREHAHSTGSSECPRASIVIVVRNKFLGRFLRHREIIPGNAKAMIAIERLRADQATESIHKICGDLPHDGQRIAAVNALFEEVSKDERPDFSHGTPTNLETIPPVFVHVFARWLKKPENLGNLRRELPYNRKDLKDLLLDIFRDYLQTTVRRAIEVSLAENSMLRSDPAGSAQMRGVPAWLLRSLILWISGELVKADDRGRTEPSLERALDYVPVKYKDHPWALEMFHRALSELDRLSIIEISDTGSSNQGHRRGLCRLQFQVLIQAIDSFLEDPPTSEQIQGLPSIDWHVLILNRNYLRKGLRCFQSFTSSDYKAVQQLGLRDLTEIEQRFQKRSNESSRVHSVREKLKISSSQLRDRDRALRTTQELLDEAHNELRAAQTRGDRARKRSRMIITATIAAVTVLLIWAYIAQLQLRANRKDLEQVKKDNDEQQAINTRLDKDLEEETKKTKLAHEAYLENQRELTETLARLQQSNSTLAEQKGELADNQLILEETRDALLGVKLELRDKIANVTRNLIAIGTSLTTNSGMVRFAGILDELFKGSNLKEELDKTQQEQISFSRFGIAQRSSNLITLCDGVIEGEELAPILTGVEEQDYRGRTCRGSNGEWMIAHLREGHLVVRILEERSTDDEEIRLTEKLNAKAGERTSVLAICQLSKKSIAVFVGQAVPGSESLNVRKWVWESTEGRWQISQNGQSIGEVHEKINSWKPAKQAYEEILLPAVPQEAVFDTKRNRLFVFLERSIHVLPINTDGEIESTTSTTVIGRNDYYLAMDEAKWDVGLGLEEHRDPAERKVSSRIIREGIQSSIVDFSGDRAKILLVCYVDINKSASILSDSPPVRHHFVIAGEEVSGDNWKFRDIKTHLADTESFNIKAVLRDQDEMTANPFGKEFQSEVGNVNVSLRSIRPSPSGGGGSIALLASSPDSRHLFTSPSNWASDVASDWMELVLPTAPVEPLTLVSVIPFSVGTSKDPGSAPLLPAVYSATYRTGDNEIHEHVFSSSGEAKSGFTARMLKFGSAAFIHSGDDLIIVDESGVYRWGTFNDFVGRFGVPVEDGSRFTPVRRTLIQGRTRVPDSPVSVVANDARTFAAACVDRENELAFLIGSTEQDSVCVFRPRFRDMSTSESQVTAMDCKVTLAESSPDEASTINILWAEPSGRVVAGHPKRGAKDVSSTSQPFDAVELWDETSELEPGEFWMSVKLIGDPNQGDWSFVAGSSAGRLLYYNAGRQPELIERATVPREKQTSEGIHTISLLESAGIEAVRDVFIGTRSGRIARYRIFGDAKPVLWGLHTAEFGMESMCALPKWEDDEASSNLMLIGDNTGQVSIYPLLDLGSENQGDSKFALIQGRPMDTFAFAARHAVSRMCPDPENHYVLAGTANGEAIVWSRRMFASGFLPTVRITTPSVPTSDLGGLTFDDRGKFGLLRITSNSTLDDRQDLYFQTGEVIEEDEN